MSSAPVPAAAAQDPPSQEIPRGLRLLYDSKALVWPATAALLAALLHFFGYAATRGKTAALGVYQLAQPSISQDYVMKGGVTLAALGLQVVLIVLVARGLWAIAKHAFRRLPNGVQARIGAVPKRAGWGWIAVTAAFAILATGLSITSDLAREADGMILEPAMKVGTAWMRMSVDQDQDWQLVYQLLLAAVLTMFVALSWWILTRFATSTVGRAIYGAWVVLQVFNLVAGFAFVYGAAATIEPYPIVAFSNVEQLLGKNAIPVLIGSDDKVYAFLVLFTGAKRTETPNPAKVILYLPRTEVKWLTVLRQEPLHIIAHYHDLKRMAPATPPMIPAPVPDSSGPGVPTGSTPSQAPAKSNPTH